MPARAIKQPNGLYARFSTVVDDFTDYDCTREELFEIFKEESGTRTAEDKMKRADENLGRFEEAIQIISRIHGKKLAEERRVEFSQEAEPDSGVLFDWNTLSLDQMATHLKDKFKYDSSGDAKCIYSLIEFYEKHKAKDDVA